MIKILMVFGSTGMGGAQAFVLNVLRNINRNKFQIDVAVNKIVEKNGINDELTNFGAQIFVLPYFRVYNYFSYKKAWHRFLSNNHYDIVYAHSTNSASIYLDEAKKLGIKTIAHSHSAGFRGGLVERLTKSIFAKKVGSVSDYWFACSEEAAKRLYGNNFKAHDNYYRIPNAIESKKYLFDLTIRKEIRNHLNIDDDVFLCGHVGTFSSPKNHYLLIDIFSEILKNRPNSKLVCCGTGVLLEDIKAYAELKGVINEVIFAGVVMNVNEYMTAMDAFIFPSLFEGFPISILEAEASGLNILMSDVITKEVILCDLVHVCDLNRPAADWAKIILDMPLTNNNRKVYNQIISDSIYDISVSIRSLENMFINLVN